MRVVIVGAGLGGLAAAIAVRAAGHDVTVYERAAELRETGAGIGLMPNGVLALDALGVGDQVRARATSPRGGTGLRDRLGRTLLAADQEVIATRVGAPVVVLARQWLHRLLVKELPAGTVRTGVAVHGVHRDGSRLSLDTEGCAGEPAADLVVAADGAQSVLRSQLYPDHPGTVGSGEFAARALVPLPAGLDADDVPAGELLDHRTGDRFGCLSMADGLVYWYSTWHAAAPTEAEERHRWLLQRRADWHAAVPALIAATAPDALHVAETVRLRRPLPSLVAGRVALLGDAGHVMTPDLGQGGCQAFEDAVVLGGVLAGVDNAGQASGLADALHGYDRLRGPHTASLQRSAARANRTLTMTGHRGRLRDAVLRRVPQAMATTALARQFRFSPRPGPVVIPTS